MKMIFKYALAVLLFVELVEAKVGGCSLKELGRYSDKYFECLKQEAIKTDAIEDINFYAYHLSGGEMDDDIFWYKKSVDKGDLKAIYQIANIYRGYDKPLQAITWYKRAAKAHYPDAMEQLSKLMQTTYGNDSLTMYQKEIAAGKDVYWNMQFLANFYLRLEEFEKAKETYEAVMNKFPDEKAEILFAIGNLYGKSFLNDGEKEVAYYKQSAALGNKQAMFNLGIYYGDRKDYEKAEGYFIESDHGRMVCFMYEEKLKDNDRALACYKKQAESGKSEDLFSLALTYANVKSYDKAIEYYTKAYDLGFSKAAIGLGYTYRDLLKDREKGIYWYHKAADMGEDGAITYLMTEGEL